jgi:hypothetical protein
MWSNTEDLNMEHSDKNHEGNIEAYSETSNDLHQNDTLLAHATQRKNELHPADLRRMLSSNAPNPPSKPQTKTKNPPIKAHELVIDGKIY